MDMKRILILFLAGLAGWMLDASAAPADLARAVAEVRASIDAAERRALETQSLDELNAAAYEQVVRELKLSREQRKRFEPLYREYRRALDRAVDASAAQDRTFDDAAQRRALKAKLGNISATAQVKRDYVDRFAEILTAEQIRLLYNTEGQIASGIKRATAGVQPAPAKLRGSGRLVTQDWGAVGEYAKLVAGVHCRVTVSSTARTVSVTADDNVIDHLSMECQDGTLSVRLVQSVGRSMETSNISISVVVPASPALRTVVTQSYGAVICRTPLRGEAFEVQVGSFGSVEAELDAQQTVGLSVSSYGKFTGDVHCDAGKIDITSYGSLSGSVTCRTQGALSIGSYAKYAKGSVAAPDLTLAVGSGGSFGGDAIAKDELKLSVQSYGKFVGSVACGRGTVRVASFGSVNGRVAASGDVSLALGSYAKFSGAVACSSAELRVQSYGAFSGTFAGDALDASVGSYGRISLSGSATVRTVKAEVGMSAVYSAPELRAVDYDVQVQNYGRATLWCSGTLKASAASSARIDYDGPCKVESAPTNVRRR